GGCTAVLYIFWSTTRGGFVVSVGISEGGTNGVLLKPSRSLACVRLLSAWLQASSVTFVISLGSPFVGTSRSASITGSGFRLMLSLCQTPPPAAPSTSAPITIAAANRPLLNLPAFSWYSEEGARDSRTVSRGRRLAGGVSMRVGATTRPKAGGEGGTT